MTSGLLVSTEPQRHTVAVARLQSRLRRLVLGAHGAFAVAAALLVVLHLSARWGGIDPVTAMLSDYALRRHRTGRLPLGRRNCSTAIPHASRPSRLRNQATPSDRVFFTPQRLRRVWMRPRSPGILGSPGSVPARPALVHWPKRRCAVWKGTPNDGSSSRHPPLVRTRRSP
jgi:hypothetical protein